MRSKPRHVEQQKTRGISLPLALVALLVGTLLVVPLLYHLRSRYVTLARYQQVTRAQYASEAGVEYGIHRLISNAGFRGLVRSRGSAGVTETMSEQVNGLSPEVQIAVVERSFHYAIWGDSQTCSSSFDWTGSNNLLDGDAHSNAGIKLSGATVEGVLEYVSSPQINSNSVTFTDPISNPIQVDAWHLESPLFEYTQYTDPSLAHTVAWEESPDHFVHWLGDLDITSSEQITPAIYYVEGDLHINGDDIVGTATFVVDGLIKVNGSGIHLTPYRDSLLFYTNYAYPENTRCSKWVVDIVGSGNDVLDGWIYAPHGMVHIGGSGSLAGAFYADSVVIAGSGLQVHRPPALDGQLDCETYDIVSTAGGIRTESRLTICYDSNEVNIKSWTVLGAAE